MFHEPIHKKSGERGSVLVVTMLVLFVLSIIGTSLSLMSSTDLRISGNQRNTSRALTVAEAGLNEAIHRLVLPNPTTVSVGGWTGNAAISDTEPYDPNWEVRFYLASPASVPPGGGSIVTTGTVQNPGGATFMEYSRPSGTDDVLTIVHKWDDDDNDNVRDPDEIVRYDPEQIPPENLTSGFPVEIVTVTGRAGQAKRTIQAEVTRRVLAARTLGALYTDKAIDVTGTPAFCGNNHDVAIPPGTTPNACFAFHLGTGALPGITTTGDEVDVQGNASDVIGEPAPTDTSSTNPFYSLAEVLGISQSQLNQILSDPHNTSIVDPLDGITYIQGDASINSNLTGIGLLYITGDLTANGGFEYTGLIYVEGDLQFTGNPWILGSVIVRGTGDFQFGAGNAAVLYGKDAIQQAIGQFMPALVLSWREL